MGTKYTYNPQKMKNSAEKIKSETQKIRKSNEEMERILKTLAQNKSSDPVLEQLEIQYKRKWNDTGSKFVEDLEAIADLIEEYANNLNTIFQQD